MSIIKSSLIFLTGTALGSGITWYFMQKKVNEANDAIQKAVDEVKESYSKSKHNVELKEDISKTLPIPDTKTSLAVEAIKRYNIFNGEEAEKMIVNKEDKNYISEISMSEFDDALYEGEYSRKFLTYYEKDDVVVDSEDYSPLDDPEEYLGENFKELLSADEAIHIRNEREGFVYEVVIDSNETLNDVLGEAEED